MFWGRKGWTLNKNGTSTIYSCFNGFTYFIYLCYLGNGSPHTHPAQNTFSHEHTAVRRLRYMDAENEKLHGFLLVLVIVPSASQSNMVILKNSGSDFDSSSESFGVPSCFLALFLVTSLLIWLNGTDTWHMTEVSGEQYTGSTHSHPVDRAQCIVGFHECAGNSPVSVQTRLQVKRHLT